MIRRSTDNGDGFLRYNGDGYGDRSTDGRPWAPSGQGNGHLWPVLDRRARPVGARHRRPRRGDQAARGDEPDGLGVGLIPEQAWELPNLARSPFGTDPTLASIGFINGESVGSAAALTWSAGQFVRLMRDVSAGRVLDRPFYTRDRYVRHTQRETPLTVTAPADNTSVGNSVLVDGHVGAAATRSSSAATNIDANTVTTTHAATAGPDGRFSLDRAADRRHERAQRRRHQRLRRDRPRGPHRRVRRAPRDAAVRGRRPERRRQRARQLRLPDRRRLPRGRVRHGAVPGVRRGRPRRVPGPQPRPVADVREPARRPADRRLRPRAGR